MRLAGRVAMVTGAASGMGLATARAFAGEGASVVLTDILPEGADRAAEIAETGHPAIFRAHDVSDAEAWEAATRAALETFGRIDILVNNAGISGSGVADVTDPDLFGRLIGINLRGCFLGIRAVVPPMRAKGGSIVNIASICAEVGTPGVHLGYHASKGGIVALTKAAAAEYGPHGIRVNAILPGAMPPMRDRGLATHEARERIIAALPLRRIGETGDVARAALYLASAEASYVTGAALVVDGGFLAV